MLTQLLLYALPFRVVQEGSESASMHLMQKLQQQSVRKEETLRALMMECRW